MIRFKVVRASRILLFLAIGLLAAVLCVIIARYALEQNNTNIGASASLVQSTIDGEAGTLSVFASRAVRRPSPGAMEVEILSDTPAPQPFQSPSVLIYHTHTHEAYDPVKDDPYQAVEAWRTTDAGHSVVRVGDELARELTALGFDVVHDTTDHENDALATAYTRSLQTLMGYERTFDLYIDLHRDAYTNGMRMRYTDAEGKNYAQIMALIGNGNGFDEKPFYRENLAFARCMTDRLNAIMPGLCKEVLVKDGRYNQHIGVFSILIEVGHNRNTLKEALNAVPPLARAIADVFENPDEAVRGYMHH